MFRLSTVLVLSLAATLLMVGVGMIVSLLPGRIHAMTGGLEGVGLLASVFALAYLLAQLPTGLLSDRFGAKPFLVAGYILCGLAGLLFFAARDANGIYLGRVLQGIGEAPIWALGPAILSRAYPLTKGRTIGLYNAAIHAGLTCGPVLGLALAPDGTGGAPFLVFTGLCLGAGVLILGFLPAVPVANADSGLDVRGFLVILRSKTPARLLAGVLLYGAGYAAFNSVLPISLAGTHGFGRIEVSLVFVLFYAGIGLSQIAAGVLSDRFGRDRFLVWGPLLAAIGFAGFPFVPGLWAYAPLGLAALGLGMFCVVAMAELSDCVPDALRGAISGSFCFFWAIGWVIGPMLVVWGAALAPLAGYLALAAAFAVLALVPRQG